MRYLPKLIGGLALGVVTLFAACTTEPYQAATPLPQPTLVAAPTTTACSNCGVITTIQTLSPTDYQVTVRLDNGSVQTIQLPAQPAFQVGDRVEIMSQPAGYDY